MQCPKYLDPNNSLDWLNVKKKLWSCLPQAFNFISEVEVLRFKPGCAGSCLQRSLTDGTVGAPWAQGTSLPSFSLWPGPGIKQNLFFKPCSHPLWLNFTGCPHLSFLTQFSPSYCKKNRYSIKDRWKVSAIITWSLSCCITRGSPRTVRDGGSAIQKNIDLLF